MSILQFSRINSKKAHSVIAVLLLLVSHTAYSQIADFSYSLSNNCAPTVVTFNNLSTTGGGLEYMWNFGKGADVFSDDMVLEVAYSAPGNYNVKLSVINGTDTIPEEKTITVHLGPEAGFSISDSLECVPATIQFASTSIAGDAAINSYFWDLRDGTTYTSESFEYTYQDAGDKDVFLRVTDNNGCSSYIESPDLIKVKSLPEIEFTASETFSCSAPLRVSFTNKSKGNSNLSFLWNFGNGQSSTNYSSFTDYLSEGVYNVSLEATDGFGCTNSVTKEEYISIGSETGDIFALVNNQVIIQDSAWICPGEIRFNSTLNPQADYTWIVDYNGVVNTYTGDSLIDLELLDSGKVYIQLDYGTTSVCPNSINKTFFIDYVKAEFDLDKYYTCMLPESITTINNSENASSYEWVMPDGSQSGDLNVSYNTPWNMGFKADYSHDVNQIPFPFTLMVENANGCRDTLTKEFEARLPVARFMPDTVSGCAPLLVTFSDSSRSDENIVEWTYLFDGAQETDHTGLPVQHTFSDVGEFDVKLIIRDDQDCIDTSYSVKIITGRTFEPDFEVSPVNLCSNTFDSITLRNNTDLEGYDASWKYSCPPVFNTGAIQDSILSIPIRSDHTGGHDISFSINYNGCLSDTTIENAIDVSGPVGSFYQEFDCETPLDYTFISDIDSATNQTWVINGAIFNNMDTVNYIFPSSGDYEASLTTTNSATGCTYTKRKIIKVRQVHAEFVAQAHGCMGEQTLLNAGASRDYIDSCYNEGFLWDFGGDYVPRRTYNPYSTFVYADTGNFTIKLTVVADNGCVDSMLSNIQIHAPYPDFIVAPDSGCAPTQWVTFNYDTVDAYIEKWTWYFGDYTMDSTSSTIISHKYTANADYTFLSTLLVTDIYGCKAYKSKPITISKPITNFQAIDNLLCVGDQTNFTVLNSTYDSLLIDFGDGNSSTTNLQHTYNLPGEFDVSLTIHENGCSLTNVMPDYIVVEDPSADYTLSDSVFTCYPLTVNFNHQQTGGTILTGIWQFEEGVTSSSFNSSTQYTYSKPGVYQTSLEILTMNGCKANSSKQIIVNVPYAEFDFLPKQICSGDVVSFNMLDTSNIESFQWLFGDGQTSNDYSVSHQYFVRGTIVPEIYVSNADCEYTLTFDTLYSSLVQADFSLIDNKLDYCRSESVFGLNNSRFYDQSIWSLNGEEISTSQNLNYSLSEEGQLNLQLVVSDSNNCTDTASTTIQVYPLPSFEIIGDTIVCYGEQAELSVNQEVASWIIDWTPSDMITSPNSFSTSASIDTNSTLFATVTNQYGCSSIRGINIDVSQPISVLRIPLSDTSIYLGQNLQLLAEPNSEDVTINWLPDYNISCQTCTDPTVKPEQTTTYQVNLTGECVDQTLDFLVEVILDFYLEFPNAFTPNGDNHNDEFNYEYENLKEIDFQIYNRWGNRVFSSNTLGEGWDGVFQGRDQNIDTYTYYVRAVSNHGYIFEKKGTFNLLK